MPAGGCENSLRAAIFREELRRGSRGELTVPANSRSRFQPLSAPSLAGKSLHANSHSR